MIVPPTIAGSESFLAEPEVSALEEPARGRGLLVTLFVIYLVLLVWIVLWKLEVPYVGGGALRRIKLVPFLSSGGSGASKPVEIAGNLLLFVPFGLYLGLLAPPWRWWRAAAVLAGASLLLEIAQYVLALGSSDVTDVLVNTAGGLAGFGLVVLARRRLGERTGRVMTPVCVAGTVLAVLAVGIFVASPIRYAPPRSAPSSASSDD